jgi:hypothetical protein
MESPTYTGSPSCRAEIAVQNVKIRFVFTGLCRYAIQKKLIGRLGNTDIGFSREIQRGIPSSTN